MSYKLDPIIAEAYRRAALAGRDMLVFAGQINRAQAALPATADLYVYWERLDDLVGEALQIGDDTQNLQLLHQAFIDALPEYFAQRVLASGEAASAAWNHWLSAFSEASFHWRLQAMQALCEMPGLVQHFGKKLEPYRQFIRYFFDRRWVETRPVFFELATDKNLPEDQRGYHHYVCGQIDQYFHYDYEQAKTLFEKAREMLRGKALGLHGLIEYYLKGPDLEKNLDRALALAEEALALEPEHAPSLVQKADVLVEKGALAEAENLYRFVNRKRPGYTQGYTRLVDLFGKPELFEKKENELEGLLKTVLQLDPQTGFLSQTDLGSIYQQQGEAWFSKAENCHRAAIEAYPEGTVAPLNLGYFFLDYRKDLKQAAAIFEAVYQRVPDTWTTVLAMARLREAEENWETALEAYDRVQQVIPSWERFMLATHGRILRQLGRIAEAEKMLLAAWKLDLHDDSGAMSEVYELAQTLYKDPENPRPEEAIELLKHAEKARKNIPPDIAAGIANRQGHVYFYVERYAEALPFYQKAASLLPEEPVYFTNQFDCLEKLYRQAPDETLYQQALEALSKASELTEDVSIEKKRRGLALLRHNPHLAELPTLYPIHVEIGQPLLSQVTTDFANLLPEMTTLTDALRSRVLERFSINLPGLRYRDITDGDGVFQFRLYETPVWLDRLPLAEKEEPTMAAVLEHLEQFVSQYCLDLFINYRDIDKEIPLLPNAELVHFTRVVMALLDEQTPMPPLPELHQQYRRIDGLRQPVAAVVEQLRLWERLRGTLPGVQPEYRYIGLGEPEEVRLINYLSGQGDARTLALPLDYTRGFLGAIIRKTEQYGEQSIALVTRQEQLRPYLRSVLAALPRIPVLKTAELPADAEGRFVETLVVEASDDAFFLQTYQKVQSEIAPDAETPKS